LPFLFFFQGRLRETRQVLKDKQGEERHIVNVEKRKKLMQKQTKTNKNPTQYSNKNKN